MAPALTLQDRRILITGASSGIGRATALLLCELGAEVILVARREEALAEVAASVAPPGKAIVAPFDLTNIDGIPKLVAEIKSRVGPLSGLVHCAGVRSTLPLQAITPRGFRSDMEINVLAGLALAQAFRRRSIRTAPAAEIVFVSSVAALAGSAATSVYAGCKGALISLARALAVELAGEGIRVNCVAPGLVRSRIADELEATVGADPMTKIREAHPLGLGEPKDVAHAIAFLLSDWARWITGSTLVVDGGYTAA
jgi:NAD(P)-dependent dehydrogenase (short-subunit alcohol dehydrogenase family)